MILRWGNNEKIGKNKRRWFISGVVSDSPFQNDFSKYFKGHCHVIIEKLIKQW